MRADARSASDLSASWMNISVASQPQSVSKGLTSGSFEESSNFHAAIKCTWLKLELAGRSAYTPATFTDIVLSIVIVRPIGSAAPKISLTADTDSNTEEGS